MSELTYMQDYLKPLIGATIERLIYDESDGQLFFGFMMKNGGQTYTVWVLCDPEGNGPGHLDIANEASK